MAQIASISSCEILDSRGFPTIQTRVTLADGVSASSSVPSGASKGTFEAFELRDADPNRLGGLGVLRAVENVNSIIAPKLKGVEASGQKDVDKILIELDGTENKSKLGANAILSVSQAVVKASALSARMPTYKYIQMIADNTAQLFMPTPVFNMIEGGKHSKNSLNFQEFLVIPASVKSFVESMEIGATLYSAVAKTIDEHDFQSIVADEGGYGPDLPTNHEGLVILKNAIEKTSYGYALDVFLGLDVAANTFTVKGLYSIKDKPNSMKGDGLIEFYKQIFSEFSLIYIEDPFAETDLASWKKLTSILSQKALVVGDDLTSTNPYKLQNAISNDAINSIVIKPNQIGTITEAIAVAAMAKFKKYKLVVSHRSGETEDNFVADFSVGIGAEFVKFGAPARERVAKYNRLSEIAHEIGPVHPISAAPAKPVDKLVSP